MDWNRYDASAASCRRYGGKNHDSMARHFSIHYTPKHGSWLDMAETELGILSRQCLDRRLPDRETLTREVAAWESSRNAAESKVHWRFTTADARIKLKTLYPTNQPR